MMWLLLLLQLFRNALDPSLATQAPTVAFVVPTSSSTYDAGASSTVAISGTATAPTGVTICAWTNSLGGSGTATTAADGSWSVESVSLVSGSNVITVSCQNSQNIPGTAVLTVTRTSAGPPIAASRLPGGVSTVPNPTWAAAGVTGGIPSSSWTQCGSTIAAYTGTAATINNAINACGTNQFVKLGAGTFTLSGGITFNSKSNVALRGSGPNSTIIKIQGTVGACFGGGSSIFMGACSSTDTPANLTNVSAGVSQGSTSITVASASGYATNALAILDQFDDANTDTGQVWICARTPTCSLEGGGPGRPLGTCDGNGGPGCRNQAQAFRVTGVSGTTITLSDPIQMSNWAIGRTPQLFGGTSATARFVGLEDLSVQHNYTFSTDFSGIQITFCLDCWVKNVRSINGMRNHIWSILDAHLTVRDSYFYGSASGGSSQSYGIELKQSYSALLENNIVDNTSGALEAGGTSGSVLAYNYTPRSLPGTPGWMFAQTIQHDAGTAMNLYEGNDDAGWAADVIHGTGHFGTVVRNYYTGKESCCTNQTFPIGINAFERFNNVLGNVMGTSGYHNTYEVAANSATDSRDPASLGGNTSIYLLGWSNGIIGTNIAPSDTLVKSTMFRWGNYDVVTGNVRWCGNSSNTGWTTRCSSTSEVPTGLSNFANTVPSAETVPTSYYLSAKPSFFTNAGVVWPPIGPDVTGGNISGVGGFANKIPARVCFESLTDDPAFTAGTVKLFPGTCY